MPKFLRSSIIVTTLWSCVSLQVPQDYLETEFSKEALVYASIDVKKNASWILQLIPDEDQRTKSPLQEFFGELVKRVDQFFVRYNTWDDTQLLVLGNYHRVWIESSLNKISQLQFDGSFLAARWTYLPDPSLSIINSADNRIIIKREKTLPIAKKEKTPTNVIQQARKSDIFVYIPSVKKLIEVLAIKNMPKMRLVFESILLTVDTKRNTFTLKTYLSNPPGQNPPPALLVRAFFVSLSNLIPGFPSIKPEDITIDRQDSQTEASITLATEAITPLLKSSLSPLFSQLQFDEISH